MHALSQLPCVSRLFDGLAAAGIVPALLEQAARELVVRRRSDLLPEPGPHLGADGVLLSVEML